MYTNTFVTGPAPIVHDPVTPTIPFRMIPKDSDDYPYARADSRPNRHDGSQLFIVDKWSMKRHRPPWRLSAGDCVALNVAGSQVAPKLDLR